MPFEQSSNSQVSSRTTHSTHAITRSLRSTDLPPVPGETNCHLCFKHGVHFRIQTGAERIVKKYSTQAVSHWSCRWISFWKGKLLSIVVNFNARLAGSRTELKNALESVQMWIRNFAFAFSKPNVHIHGLCASIAFASCVRQFLHESWFMFTSVKCLPEHRPHVKVLRFCLTAQTFVLAWHDNWQTEICFLF